MTVLQPQISALLRVRIQSKTIPVAHPLDVKGQSVHPVRLLPATDSSGLGLLVLTAKYSCSNVETAASAGDGWNAYMLVLKLA